jgi:hypothetical protein
MVEFSHEGGILALLAQFEQARKESLIARKSLACCQGRVLMYPLDFLCVEGQARKAVLGEKLPDLVWIVQGVLCEHRDDGRLNVILL